jgi:hypothetical protein
MIGALEQIDVANSQILTTVKKERVVGPAIPAKAAG